MNIQTKYDNIPWVEKYRPNHYQDIILEDTNKSIFNTILKDGSFPNILLYGPPGTGKTTTIMNITKLFLQKFHVFGKELIVHLNASDERGIDVIRNQINIFTKTNVLFNKGVKFIILDEADYMTKNAQQSLRTIIYERNPNIKFCVICNYISKIDDSLKHEFIPIRFNNLPIKPIKELLFSISYKENIHHSEEYIESILSLFGSDIRSMINYLQVNQINYIETKCNPTSPKDITFTILSMINNNKFNIEGCGDNMENNISIHENTDGIDEEQLIKEVYSNIIQICRDSKIDIHEYFIEFCGLILKNKILQLPNDILIKLYPDILYVVHAFRVNIEYKFNLILYKLIRIL